MDRFRVLMVPTQNSGIMYWRMWNYWVGAHRNNLADWWVMWHSHEINDTHPWEIELMRAHQNGDDGPIIGLTKQINDGARQADAIVFGLCHTYHSLNIFEALLEMREMGHLRDTPLLVEIDDLMTAVPTANAAAGAYAPNSPARDIAIRHLQMADGVITTTNYLKAAYSRYNKNICVIPNSIDFEHWGKCQNKPKPGVRIGWCGGATHSEDLRIIEDVIPAVLAENKQARFVFIHGIPQFLKDLRAKYPNRIELHQTWTKITDYPKMLSEMDIDIALAPLVDSSFNRAKSNLRWLEAGALGIPCVASNVGHFAETITNGHDGVLVENSSTAAWTGAILRLVRDAKERRRMGLAAKATILERFNVDKVTEQYIHDLKNAATRIRLKRECNEYGKVPASQPGVASSGGPAADTILGAV